MFDFAAVSISSTLSDLGKCIFRLYIDKETDVPD